MTNPKTTEYLKKIFEEDSYFDAESKIAFRENYINEDKTRSTSFQQRREARWELNSIRSDFWTLSETDLETKLKALEVLNFPEVQKSVDHLRDVYKLKNEINIASEDPSLDPVFAEVLKERVLLPGLAIPQNSEIRTGLQVKSEIELRMVKKSCKILRAKYPEVANYLKPWLRVVDRYSRVANPPTEAFNEYGVPVRNRTDHIPIDEVIVPKQESEIGCSGSFWIFLLIYALVRILFAIAGQ